MTRYSRQKARDALRVLDEGALITLLHRALDLLPEDRIPAVFDGYVFPEKLRADEPEPSLRDAVQTFRAASLAKKFYEPFEVNWRNSSEMSRGTHQWIAECHRLLDWACRLVEEGAVEEPREAFDVILELLAQINDDPDSIIFFADEAGAWQVGVSWERVLPAYFKVLAATTRPKVYARTVLDVIEEHVDHAKGRFLECARTAATDEGRAALAALLAR